MQFEYNQKDNYYYYHFPLQINHNISDLLAGKQNKIVNLNLYVKTPNRTV